jgi:adenylate kinase family enzyme
MVCVTMRVATCQQSTATARQLEEHCNGPWGVSMVCCVQRADDTEEKANIRIKVYHDNVNAVTGYYKDQMVQVDGNVDMESVFQQVTAALDQACMETA